MAGEVKSCPKGWGEVKFTDNMICPISRQSACINCEIGAKNELSEEKFEKLKGSSKK